MSESRRPPAFVVGGAGFVGSHLVDRLLAEGHPVDVVDDLSTGSLANLASAREQAAGDLKIHHLDARRPELADLMTRRGVGTVFLLAALPPVLGEAPHLSRLRDAVHVVSNTVEAAVAARASKVVVLVPAGPLYGPVAAKDQPVREPPSGPTRSIEGVAVRVMIDLLSVVRDLEQLEFTVLAATGVYGPRQRPDGGIVAGLVASYQHDGVPRLPGDGRQRIDLVYVDDVVDALVRAGARGSGLVVNLGWGTAMSTREVCELLGLPAGVLTSTGPWPAGEPERLALSPVRARIHLGWSAWTPVADGVLAALAVGDP